VEIGMERYLRALSAAGIDVRDDDLAAIESCVVELEKASAKGDTVKALRYSRALLSALPGDPTTLPRPALPTG